MNKTFKLAKNNKNKKFKVTNNTNHQKYIYDLYLLHNYILNFLYLSILLFKNNFFFFIFFCF